MSRRPQDRIGVQFVPRDLPDPVYAGRLAINVFLIFNFCAGLQRRRPLRQRRRHRLQAVQHMPHWKIRHRRRPLHGQRHMERLLHVHRLPAMPLWLRAHDSVRRVLVRRHVQAVPSMPRAAVHRQLLECHLEENGLRLLQLHAAGRLCFFQPVPHQRHMQRHQTI